MMRTCVSGIILKALLLLAAFSFQLSPVHAQGTAFTYQGRLTVSGQPASGIHDLRFAIHDAASGGAQQGATLTNSATAVSNGLFTVTLDFGNQFPGANRWLEIGVRTNGGGTFATLDPRQPLTPTPYAIQTANATTAAAVSGSVSVTQLTGTISSNNIGAGSITTVMLATGAVATAGAGRRRGRRRPRWPWSPTGSPRDDCQSHPGELATSSAYSLAAVGNDRVLIGAYQDDTGETDAGAAYLFSTNGTLLTTFTNPTPAASDYFGYSVAAVGSDRVLIGAYQDDTGGADAGVAYLFSTNGTLLTTFTNPTPAASDYFGYSVAAVGSDQVLIGAYQDNTGAAHAGAAYLFSTNGTLLTTFTNPTPAAWRIVRQLGGGGGERPGAHWRVFGRHRRECAGSAYLFSTNGTLLTTFTNPTPAAGDLFGVVGGGDGKRPACSSARLRTTRARRVPGRRICSASTAHC